METGNQSTQLDEEKHLQDFSENGLDEEMLVVDLMQEDMDTANLPKDGIDPPLEGWSVLNEKDAVSQGVSCITEPPKLSIITEEDAKRAVLVYDPFFIDDSRKDSLLEDNNGMELDDLELSPGSPNVTNTEFAVASDNVESKKPESGKIDEALGFAHNLRGSTLMTRLSKSTVKDDMNSKVLSPRSATAATEDDISDNELPVFSTNSFSKEKQKLFSVKEPVQKASDDYNRGVRLVDAANRYGVPAATLYSKLKSKPKKISRKSGAELEEAIQNAIRDHGRGLSMRTACTRNGVSSSAVLSRLKKKSSEHVDQKSESSVEKGKAVESISDSYPKRTMQRETRGSLARALQRSPEGTHGDEIKVNKIIKGVSWTQEAMENALKDIKDGMTIGRASEIYEIPSSTIRDRISGRVGSKKLKAVSWTPEAMEFALQDIKDGMTINQASKIYQIPPSTIHDRVFGRIHHQSKGERRMAERLCSSVSWTEERMKNAVESVHTGESLSSVSEKCGIPPSTINDRFRSMYPQGRKPVPKRSRKTNPAHTSKDVSQQPEVEDGDKKATMHVSKNEHESIDNVKCYPIKSNSKPRKQAKKRQKGSTRATKRNAKQILTSARHFEQEHARTAGENEGEDELHGSMSDLEWTEEDMMKAMPNGTLRPRMARRNRARLSSRSQRMLGSWSQENEGELAQYVDKLNSYGFIPSNDDELLELVKDFVEVKRFNNLFDDVPLDKSWLNIFLERNDSGMKMSRIMKSNQKAESGSSNPFVIYNFFDALEQISSQKTLESDKIWTCCEVCFPSDPRKVKGRLRSGIGLGCGTACLISCCGAGQVLDPFIIHQEAVDHSALENHASLLGTCHVGSQSGRITATVFDSWFKNFAATVIQRPLLVIVDSKLTYISAQTIERAASEEIFLMKLPCNTSYALQPLWQSCFAELASQWKSSLTDWRKKHRNEVITGAHFAEELCAIWNESLSSDSIIAGFESTGIFPVNRTKFPSDKLDRGLVRLHTVWLAAGKPEHMAPDVPSFFHPLFDKPRVDLPSRRATRSAKHPVPLDISEGPDPIENDSSPSGNLHTASGHQSPSPSDSTSISHFPVCWCRKPPAPIPGKKWVPTWTLLDDTNYSNNSSG